MESKDSGPYFLSWSSLSRALEEVMHSWAFTLFNKFTDLLHILLYICLEKSGFYNQFSNQVTTSYEAAN